VGAREGHDRARPVADEDRALAGTGAGDPAETRDVDTLARESFADLRAGAVVADRAREVRLYSEPRQRHGGRRRRPAARDDQIGRHDAVVRLRMPRHAEDRVLRRRSDADDVGHDTFTVSSSCGRYGMTIAPAS